MRNVHFGLGLILLAVFLFTGDYMQVLLGDNALERLSTHRMMMRASHVYILFAALLNLLLGCCWFDREERSLKALSGLGSVILALSSGLVVAAFFVDSVGNDETRLLTLWSVIGLLAGVVLHGVAGRWPGGNRQQD